MEDIVDGAAAKLSDHCWLVGARFHPGQELWMWFQSFSASTISRNTPPGYNSGACDCEL